MNKIMIVRSLLMILTAGLLSGCGGRRPELPAGDDRLRVVTTIFPPYDFARQAAGEDASVTMLLKPGEEVHSYEPTPMDIKKIKECDLFIYTGGENDVWVERILENMDETPCTLRMVDLVETYEEEHVEGMQEERGHEHDHEEDHEHEEEHEHGEDHEHEEEHTHSGDSSEAEHEEIDEHVWTSPLNAAAITEAVAEEMARLDPANAEGYRERASEYAGELRELDLQFRDLVANAQRDTIVFGDRFPLRYFVQEYGLRYYAAFPGCASETEPSASTMAFLIDKVREEQIPVVFSIEFSSGNVAGAIAESCGAVPRTFHSCHNVTKAEFEDGETCVSLMRKNLTVLREALQ